jgi:hypothetical protein
VHKIPKKYIKDIGTDPELNNILISYDRMFNIYKSLNYDNEKFKEEFKKWQNFYLGIFY